MDGYNFSVSGGGRYDNMVGNFCGQPVPATGISIGFERIITIMAEHMEKKPSIDEKNLAILLDRKADSRMKIDAFTEAKALTAAALPQIQPRRHPVMLKPFDIECSSTAQSLPPGREKIDSGVPT